MTKIEENFENNCKFNEMLLKVLIIVFAEAFHCLQRLSIHPTPSLKKLHWLVNTDKLVT